MKVRLVFITVCSSIGSQAQHPIKEQYDHLCHKQGFGSYTGVINYIVEDPGANPWSSYLFGEQVGYFLEGYLRMYETTKDKAYLIRFINLSLKAIAWRKASYLFTQPTPAYWTINDGGYLVLIAATSGSPYMNGSLLWPFAHFVHIVAEDDPELGALVIPGEVVFPHTSTIAINELPMQASYTYAGIADWMLDRTRETLDAIINEHYDYADGFCHGGTICSVNQEALFAGALLYLGHLSVAQPGTYSDLQQYLVIGARLAVLFDQQSIHLQDGCSCSTYGPFPIIRTLPNGSYWWYHAGWTIDINPFCTSSCPPFFYTNQPDVNAYTQHVEDISHAVSSLIIPTLASRFGINTGGTYPFTDADMVGFRNTFTQHVWDPSLNGFHNAVNGADYPVYPSSYNGVFNSFRYAALAWMPLQAYDGATGAAAGDNVYDVIMDFYANEVFGSPGVITGGLYHMGVADVVAAQWENECYSLTLFNRDLVYDQDFTAKAVLTVDAFGEAGASFADPVIHEPRFTVNEGVTARFRAGAAVVWEPGFEAMYTSTVVSEIDPLGCGMEYRVLAAGGMVQGEQAVAQRGDELPVRTTDSYVEEKARTKSHRVSLAPNPTFGSVRVQLELKAPCNVRVELRDGMGRSMLVSDLGVRDTGWQEHLLQLGPVTPGVYWCRVFLGEESHVLKLVVE